ncbi:hypothetical protein HDU97_000533 [Phlyctochytrium planicorne]|nr:hypothetical protein HDU97_000533 [Phlyctochytrium planicorne]
MALRVFVDPRKGRSFVASRDFDAGEIVLISKPYAAIPDSTARSKVCAFCVRQPLTKDAEAPPLPVECDGGCGWARYCSQDCKLKDWETWHKFECRALQELQRDLVWEGRTDYVEDYSWLLIRVIVVRCRELLEGLQKNEVDEVKFPVWSQKADELPGNRFKDVWAACTNSTSFDQRLSSEVLWVCLLLTRFVGLVMFPSMSQHPSWMHIGLLPSDILPLESDEFITQAVESVIRQHFEGQRKGSATDTVPKESGSLQEGVAGHPLLSDLINRLDGNLELVKKLMSSVISLICREECNSFGLYNYSRLGNTSERQGYALGYYTSPIFFNHSCSPNVGHVVRDGVPATKDTLCSYDHATLPTGETGANGCMVFYALHPIAKDTELCISYVGAVDSAFGVERRRSRLKELFFFDCDCERCGAELNHKDTKSFPQLQAFLCSVQGCKGFFRPSHLVQDMHGRESGMQPLETNANIDSVCDSVTDKLSEAPRRDSKVTKGEEWIKLG